MIGRKAVIGLSLLCAVAFWAIAAQSASAAESKNTTAFTCVKVAAGTGAFTDAHCDKAAKGDYSHTPISIGTKTNVVFSNKETKNATTEHTPAVLKGKPFAVSTEITCTDLNGTGILTNEEPAAKQHRVKGSVTSISFTNCTVQKPTSCTKVKEPIETKAEAVGVDGLGAGKNEMGVEFKPEGGGKTFTTITLEGEKCALAGKPFNVEGTAIATGGTATQTEKQAGSTGVFTNAMTKETLTAGGQAAEFSAVATTRMTATEPAIALTTDT